MSQKERDQNLLKKLLDTDGRSGIEFYTRFFPKVLSYIHTHGGNEQNARDVFQTAILLLMVQAQKEDFVIKSTLEGYFFTICKNVWRKEQKTSKNRVTNDEVIHLISEERELAVTAVEQERWQLYKEKFSELSENCRKVLEQSFKKISNTKIAELLGYASENVVRQRIFKCKTRLVKAIQSDPRYNDLKDL